MMVNVDDIGLCTDRSGFER